MVKRPAGVKARVAAFSAYEFPLENLRAMNRSALQRDCAISVKLARKIQKTDLFLRKNFLERMRGAEAERHKDGQDGHLCIKWHFHLFILYG